MMGPECTHLILPLSGNIIYFQLGLHGTTSYQGSIWCIMDLCSFVRSISFLLFLDFFSLSLSLTKGPKSNNGIIIFTLWMAVKATPFFSLDRSMIWFCTFFFLFNFFLPVHFCNHKIKWRFNIFNIFFKICVLLECVNQFEAKRAYFFSLMIDINIETRLI